MNLLLFRKNEWLAPLPPQDLRVIHIRKILKAAPGDRLEAGVIDGPLGEAVLEEILRDGSMRFDFIPGPVPPPLFPVTLLIGTPRPPTARRLLKDLTSAGIGRILFCGTDLGEKSYLTSSLWVKGEYNAAVREGLSQGKSTRPPGVERYYSLYKAIGSLPEQSDRLALDNGSPGEPLRTYRPAGQSVCLAVGPERGWSDRERQMLRDAGFSLRSLGNRVLRTETACHMGLALVQAARQEI